MIQTVIAKEYFNSAQDLLREDDRIETDITVPGWSKPLRIRALSFTAREKINQASTTPEGRDFSKYIVHTFVHGVVRPHFTLSDGDELLEHNADILEEVAEYIWQLGRLDKKIFDDYIAALKDLEHENDSKS